MTLSETLCTTAILAILMALLLIPVIKALRHARSWIYGSYAWQENRINAFLSENERDEHYYTTNAVKPWTFVP